MNRLMPSTRREFIKGSTTALGLVIGFHVLTRDALAVTAGSAQQFAPNAFLRIAPDNTITIVSKHLEHGEGIHTGLATLLAEDLDADWSQIRVVPAPANKELYKNLFNGSQSTQGSHSLANSYEQYRKAGATARAMLIGAAAQKWDVPATELAASKGVVRHLRSRRTATFGELAQAAAAIPVPGEVTLKDPKQFTLIGNETLRRVDSVEKTNGKALYGIDVTLPGMLIAVVAHSPRFGGAVKSFDASKARALAGVVDVVQIPTGVAVLANSFWVAQRARDLLRIEWDDSRAEKRGSEALRGNSMHCSRSRARSPATTAMRRRHSRAPLVRVVTATYEMPYLAHVPLEPVACVARWANSRCEIWTGDTGVSGVQTEAAKTLGLKPEQVEVHSVYAGGHFGRRGLTAIEVVSIVKAINGRAPVKLLYTRAEELQNVVYNGYRRMSMHKASAALDANGNLIAYRHRIVGQSSGSDRNINGIDVNLIGGITDTAYGFPNIFVDAHVPRVDIPVCPYRGSDAQCFVIETFIDEIAHAAGRDPLELRRALLKSPRQLSVLELVAAKAGWGTPLGPNRGRGIAVHDAYGTPLAQVAEVTALSDGTFKVDRVVCAINCGIAVNPDVIRAQIEGGIAFSLGAALHSEITLRDGVVSAVQLSRLPGTAVSRDAKS